MNDVEGELPPSVRAMLQHWQQFPYSVEYDEMEYEERFATLEEARAVAQRYADGGKTNVQLWGP